MAKRFSKNDALLLGATFLLLLAGYAWFAFLGKEEGAMVEIRIAGEFYGAYPLDREDEIPIAVGEKVTNVLWIRDGKADMASADCPDQLCVHQKAISGRGETIVCLPNKVVAEVVGGQEAGLDAMT